MKRVFLLICLLAAVGSGCSFAVAPEDFDSKKLNASRKSHQVSFDLSKPPTREEMGLSKGRCDAFYQVPDNAGLMRTSILLPGGKVFEMEASQTVPDCYGSPLGGGDTPDPPVKSMHVVRYTQDPQVALTELTTKAREFGFDQKIIDEWYAKATAPDLVLVEMSQEPKSKLMTTTFGYIRLNVVASFQSPPGSLGAGPKQMHLDFHFFWNP